MASRVNLGPLTTTFTPPASCSTAVLGCTSCTDGWLAQSCGVNTYNSQGVRDAAACWPPPRADTVETGVAFNGWGFYSPGLHCPVGYTTACSATAGVGGGFMFQFPLVPGETAYGCCPTGYTCRYDPAVDNGQTCLSTATSGTIPIKSCSSARDVSSPAMTLPATFPNPVTTDNRAAAVVSEVTLRAPLFQLQVQASSSSSSSSSSAATSSGTPGPTQTGAAPPPTGLSTGAAAGVGVACGL
ncbi:uncharacterized protein E0L32_012413, partial [Thyridium curvatum]